MQQKDFTITSGAQRALDNFRADKEEEIDDVWTYLICKMLLAQVELIVAQLLNELRRSWLGPRTCFALSKNKRVLPRFQKLCERLF